MDKFIATGMPCNHIHLWRVSGLDVVVTMLTFILRFTHTSVCLYFIVMALCSNVAIRKILFIMFLTKYKNNFTKKKKKQKKNYKSQNYKRDISWPGPLSSPIKPKLNI